MPRTFVLQIEDPDFAETVTRLSAPLARIEPDGHRAIVDQPYLHVRAEHAGGHCAADELRQRSAE